MSIPRKRIPFKSVDPIKSVGLNCCSRVRRVVAGLSTSGGPAEVFVADFHYPCAVYSALWILQQANPDADLSVLTGLSSSDIAGFLGLSKVSAEDFSETWEQVVSFAAENGLARSFPEVEIRITEDLRSFLADPANVPRGGPFVAVFVSPRKPSYMSEEQWRRSGAVGHWVAVGPERSLKTRPAFALHARRGGVHGPRSSASQLGSLSLLRKSRLRQAAGGARGQARSLRNDPGMRQLPNVEDAPSLEREPQEGEPKDPAEVMVPSDDEAFLQ